MMNPTIEFDLDFDNLPALCEDLPTLPAAAMELVRICKDADASFEELSRVVALDPGLASKILRVANSASYNRGHDITNLTRACVVLGLKTLKVMGLSFSLRTQLQMATDSQFNLDAFWERCLVTSVAARGLARLVKCPLAEEAFCCGLLSHVGQYALANITPERYRQVVDEAIGNLPTAEEERKYLPVDHHEVGGALLKAWQMPELFVAVTAHWKDPQLAPNHDVIKLAEIVRVADMVSRFVCDPGKVYAANVMFEHFEHVFGLSSDETHGFVVSIENEIADMASMLSVSYNQADLDALLDDARRQVIDISLSAVQDLEGAHAREAELTREAETLRWQAQFDALTGIPNRRYFNQRLEKAIVSRRREESVKPLGVLMVDVDYFKSVNDIYGHLIGDKVLREIAVRIGETVRDTDLLARYGGEEFVVIVHHVNGNQMESVAERVRQCVAENPMTFDGHVFDVTVSVGIAYVHDASVEDCGYLLLKLADDCLYEAKSQGRNCVVCVAAN